MNCLETFSGANSSSMTTPGLHNTPNYLGYLPQEKYRPGHTFGMTSHRVLHNPCCQMSRSKLTNIRPDHCTDDFGRFALGADPFMQSHMALVNSSGRQKYQPNMTPGGCGFVPRFQTILGHTYSPACNQSISRYDTEQSRNRLFNKELQPLDGWRFCHKPQPWETQEQSRPDAIDPQDLPRDPCNGNIREDIMQSRLIAALSPRSGCCGGGSVSGASGNGGGSWTGPQGAAGECCCGPSAPFSILSKDHPKCDYGERRMWGLATDKLLNIPCGFSNNIRINSHKFCKPLDRVQEIYRGCEGMIPSYAGHVPGEDFRMGKTYGTSTRNAKRALDETFHAPLCMPFLILRLGQTCSVLTVVVSCSCVGQFCAGFQINVRE